MAMTTRGPSAIVLAMELLNIPTQTAAIAVEGLTKRYGALAAVDDLSFTCLLYTSPSPRDRTRSRMPSSA